MAWVSGQVASAIRNRSDGCLHSTLLLFHLAQGMRPRVLGGSNEPNLDNPSKVRSPRCVSLVILSHVQLTVKTDLHSCAPFSPPKGLVHRECMVNVRWARQSKSHCVILVWIERVNLAASWVAFAGLGFSWLCLAPLCSSLLLTKCRTQEKLHYLSHILESRGKQVKILYSSPCLPYTT